MLKNYLKITLRHLYRNRLYVMLNVAGLAISISACWVIYCIVSYEFSFDTKQPNQEIIYRVASRFIFDGKESGNGGSPIPMANAIREQIDGARLVVPLYQLRVATATVSKKKQPLTMEDVKEVVATDNRFFKLVPYKWLAGSPGKALREPGQLVLTKSRAVKYFPLSRPEQVLGKTVLYNDSVAVQVTGIVDDLSHPSVFSGKEFISRQTFPEYHANLSEKWRGVSSGNQVYVLLHPTTDKEQVEKQISRISEDNMPKDLNFSRWHLLQPLSDVHFNSDYPGTSRIAHKPTLYGMMAVAAFLLLLACINYINLSIAQIPLRAREIGVHKSLGGSSVHIIARFLGETLVVLVLALGISWFLSRLFFSAYHDLVPEGMELYINPLQIILFLAGLILLTCLASGLYPGWRLARFKPVTILRGGQSLSLGGKHVRFTLGKSLIVFQFVIAQAFIIGALITAQQLKYTLEKDMGFDKEAVVVVDIPHKIHQKEKHTGYRALKQEFRKLPGVAGVSLGNPPAYSSWNSDFLTYKGQKGDVERLVYHKYVDTGMIPLYNMRLLAGRNLRQNDTIAEYVINETCARGFGFQDPSEAVGEYLTYDESKPPVPIVGVIADFHLLSFHHEIDPLAFMTDNQSLHTFNIKLEQNRAGWEKTMKELGVVWTRFFPEQPFEYKFYDEVIASFYNSERRMARMINLATGIAIIISCFGLFGLTTLTAVQRTKEIGIRKVLGASVAGIVRLLSADFIKLVLIALLVAIPIAWYAMNRWLEDFAYRIEIQWWMFALTGIMAVLIALLTVSFQSMKAALANPVKCLRSE